MSRNGFQKLLGSRRVFIACLAGMFALSITHQVLADGVMLNGVSAYTIGRGGTNIAFADNGRQGDAADRRHRSVYRFQLH